MRACALEAASLEAQSALMIAECMHQTQGHEHTSQMHTAALHQDHASGLLFFAGWQLGHAEGSMRHQCGVVKKFAATFVRH